MADELEAPDTSDTSAAPPARKRGRPRKTADAAAAPAAALQTAAAPLKRRPGRPRKEARVAATDTLPQPEPASQRVDGQRVDGVSEIALSDALAAAPVDITGQVEAPNDALKAAKRQRRAAEKALKDARKAVKRARKRVQEIRRSRKAKA